MASSVVARRALRYAEARAEVLAAAEPLPSEQVPLAEALGRPLVKALVASHPLPPFRNSAMDGIAVRSGDIGRTGSTGAMLNVTAVLPAGHVMPRRLGKGEAARIMTGAMVPEGADAVIPVEELEFMRGPNGEEQVRVRRAPNAGENVREAGLDLAAGAVALGAGHPLSPHDLALLAALGVAEPTVGRQPRVAVISTGDELLSPKDALTPGAIRDSNLPMLSALLTEAGTSVVSAHHASDDPARLADHVRAALALADVVITIGGVSAGDFDPVKLALSKLGSIELWEVAMRPGKPQAFGRPGGRLFFGLPGNPASVACVFEALVRPALRRMAGFTVIERRRTNARAAVDIESREGRTDFVRVTLARREDGWWATPAGAQVSGHITPQSRANALLIVPEPAARLTAGESAEALVLRWPDETPA